MKPVRDWKCKPCGIMSHDVPTDIPDQWCPFCGKPMDKVYTPPTVLFNGAGWTEKFYGGGKKEN